MLLLYNNKPCFNMRYLIGLFLLLLTSTGFAQIQVAKKALANPSAIDSAKVYINWSNNLYGGFTPQNIYEMLDFQNYNKTSVIGNLEILIKQEDQVLLKSESEGFDIEPGRPKIDRTKRAGFKVETNQFDQRDARKPISLHLHFWNVERSLIIPANQHAEISNQYARYTNESMGLSYDFFDFADVRPAPTPNEYLLRFTPNDSLLNHVYYHSSHNFLSPLRQNNPYGHTLSRRQTNGFVTVRAYSKDNFTLQQFKSILASINRTPDLALLERQKDNYHFLAPTQLKYKVALQTYNIKNQYGLGIITPEQYIILTLNEDQNKQSAYQIDFESVLNSISINGLSLQYDFDEDQQLRQLSISRSAAAFPVEERKQRLAGFLKIEQKVNQPNQFIVNLKGPSADTLNQLEDWQHFALNQNIPLPEFKKSRVEIYGKPDYQRYENYTVPNLPISFLISKSKKSPYRMTKYDTYPFGYYMNQNGKVVSRNQQDIPFEKHPQYPNATYIGVDSFCLMANHQFQGTELNIYQLINSPLTLNQYSAILEFELSERRPSRRSIPTDVFQAGEWQVIALKQQWLSSTFNRPVNGAIFKQENMAYLILLKGEYWEAVEVFFNSLQIDNSGFDFDFDPKGALLSVQAKQ
ncbi:MAG: hypothetical protein Sapg2KO_26790 [Saprospiraceae bacterium]